MRTSKIVFAFAMALAVGTVGLAGMSMDPGADLSDGQASQVVGGLASTGCGTWVLSSCYQSWSFGTCNLTQGWVSTTSPFGTRGTASDLESCGGFCGSIYVTLSPCGSGS